ncbi:DNA-binding protein [Bifidobacterium callimiconis]|uniref:Helix-turn-helix domain-containing protein n=1 Tax=Bifidobacterium callimiconis TaxID=2306973 RepID=A0A430FIQ3_9BIFI|nr:DNA-binding protein [Bifidobacterium callimiconis]RSX52680.1 hypothetical protein D2E23_0408 [Bifidobacterium callimiconis]
MSVIVPVEDSSRVPLGERQAWTPRQAAQVYSLDYEGVRWAINHGDLDSFCPPNRFGKPGRRRVTREAMERWIRSLET